MDYSLLYLFSVGALIRVAPSIKSNRCSWWRQAISGVEEQFNTFVSITEQYLTPTSPQEVNISWQMQASIALLQDKKTFSALNGRSRRDALQDPKNEVVRMLEQNLLAKFTQSAGMLKRQEKRKLQNLRESVFGRPRTGEDVRANRV